MSTGDQLSTSAQDRKSRILKIGALALCLALLAPIAYVLASRAPSQENATETLASDPIPAPVTQSEPKPAAADTPAKTRQVARLGPSPEPAPLGRAPAKGWLLGADGSSQTSSTSSDELRRFVTFVNRDMDGGDYAKIENIGHDACKAQCKSDGRCRGYTFNTWNDVCFLKSSVTALRIEPRGITGVLASERISVDTRAPTIQTIQSKRFPGVPYKVLQVADYDLCARECTLDRRCNGFNFSKGGRSCALIEALAKPVSSDATDSGMKLQPPRAVPRVANLRRAAPPRTRMPPEVSMMFEAVAKQIMRH